MNVDKPKSLWHYREFKSNKGEKRWPWWA